MQASGSNRRCTERLQVDPLGVAQSAACDGALHPWVALPLASTQLQHACELIALLSTSNSSIAKLSSLRYAAGLGAREFYMRAASPSAAKTAREQFPDPRKVLPTQWHANGALALSQVFLGQGGTLVQRCNLG